MTKTGRMPPRSTSFSAAAIAGHHLSALYVFWSVPYPWRSPRACTRICAGCCIRHPSTCTLWTRRSASAADTGRIRWSGLRAGSSPWAPQVARCLPISTAAPGLGPPSSSHNLYMYTVTMTIVSYRRKTIGHRPPHLV